MHEKLICERWFIEMIGFLAPIYDYTHERRWTSTDMFVRSFQCIFIAMMCDFIRTDNEPFIINAQNWLCFSFPLIKCGSCKRIIWFSFKRQSIFHKLFHIFHYERRNFQQPQDIVEIQTVWLKIHSRKLINSHE